MNHSIYSITFHQNKCVPQCLFGPFTPTVHDSLAPMVTTLCWPTNMRTFYFQDMTRRVDWFFDFIIWNFPSNLLFDIISTKFIVSWNDFVMEIKGWYKITWYEFFCNSQSLNSFTETISVVDHRPLNRVFAKGRTRYVPSPPVNINGDTDVLRLSHI